MGANALTRLTVRLPIRGKGARNCSYMSSNTVSLKLLLMEIENADMHEKMVIKSFTS